MDLTAWALYAFIAAAALAGAVWHYRRREPAGRGRVTLGLLRGLALAVLVLLLFDPSVPAGPAAARTTVVLLDGSLSMRLADAGGRTRWAEAVDAAAALGPDRIELVGGRTRAVDRLEAAEPTIPTSRIAPGLRAALESGASRVVLITDGALEDAPEVRALARQSGTLEVRRVRSVPPFNAGIVELRAPRWVEAGEEATVEAVVARLGRDGPDSVEVVLLDEGRETARRTLPAPPEGRLAAVAFRYVAPAGAAGRRLIEVLLEAGDAVAEDDRRAAFVQVGSEPPGVALVSFRPDQEPRFLLPVLERALGVPGRGWLALGSDRYVRLGLGADAGGAADPAEVRDAIGSAGLVVLHGVDGGAPAWARAAVRDARRLLVFPAGETVA
ncbi:MAG: hypothetical protein GWM90_26820, partial [Gemmatimonadetes bacterium]|nr:hypothetical protein [Gemmatimonadota bacterium]NIQ58541.1 hypothetical protein [Gemmatimonadota bacterium]NIU78735.1 hypothetical protein [Gammaproteobacteria bacterium]NIX47549.1 hypothetical protein [Gemmatimonadota bacterium]NIY11920.1 hypothetical protein [Gemmatimonadota bacterium]